MSSAAVAPISNQLASATLVHPFSASAPVRRPYARGDRQGLDEVKGDLMAVRISAERKFAKTSMGPQVARVRWWCDRCRARGWKPAPVSTSQLEIVCALLTKGQYRSADSYVNTIKRMHILAGGKWTDQHVLVARDSSRAAKRGQGLAKQVQPYGGLWSQWPPLASCVREIDSAAAKVQHVKLHRPNSVEEGCGRAQWLLPVSKIDTAAQGTVRSTGARAYLRYVKCEP